MSFRLSLATLGAAAVIGSASLAATTNPQSIDLNNDRSSRELLVAHNMMRNERIDTIGRGQVQLLFTDQSSLSIAPRSDVVINEFLYEPLNQTGNLTATVTSGLLRYVGGEISRKSGVAFYTPTAAVSVRGGIIWIRTVNVSGHVKTEVLFLSGDRVCVTASGASQCTSQFATAITSDGAGPPSPPTPISAETLRGLLGDLQSANRSADANASSGAAGRSPQNTALLFPRTKTE